ncbi:MAG: 50S ribosomal protein L7 [Oscillospiraceae bacterium]|nr:50S ribosomal protein L7 [Oscillospiraceae bacterium]
MREKTLNLLGLMRKAGAIQIGEDNSGTAVHGGKAKLLLLAADASDNARRRAEGFVNGRRTQLIELPFDKEELSQRLGSGSFAMAAVTDLGFAQALMQLLEGLEPERYGPAAEETRRRFERAERRKKEKPGRSRNKGTGKRRTNG